MRLFDTLSRETRELTPHAGARFRFYCCGPTVYGPAHIGNFRTFVLQDVLRRTLETAGVETLHVRNITDVDDKTIRDSLKAGKSLADFTSEWTKRFHTDCSKLNLLAPHVEPGAVAHIPQQIAMIGDLIARGHACLSEDGSVYFRIASFPQYGRLSHLDQRELDIGKSTSDRARSDEYGKDDLADFVLWKARRPEDGPNFWESPWGAGRPGWHLECSAMIREYLGDSFDLHSGGVDLVFPHHENEIAQSTCACGGSFARHWFHITHLLVDGGKMSKSLGNLHTLDDLEARGFTAMELRYVLIGGHYRKPLNFTLDSLHAAREALAKMAKGERALAESAGNSKPTGAVSGFGPFAEAWKALNDDLNTPAALGAMFTGLRKARDLSGPAAAAALDAFHRMLHSLGIVLPTTQATATVPDDVRALAESRWQARQQKLWQESDRLRGELLAKGWQVKDGKDTYELTRAD